MYDKIIDSIYDEEIKSFALEAVNSLPSSYGNIIIDLAGDGKAHIEKYTENLYSVVKTILTEMDVDDIVFDMFTVAVLLQYAGRFEMVNGELLESTLYPLEVRGMFKEFEVDIGREIYNDIMLVIESQMGLKSPIPQVIPPINESILMWILPIANAIVKTHNI